MELRHLRYFIALAETLNFRRAAARLNISQPPLTIQIRQLEDELGVRLFDRSNSGTFLTQPGRLFLDHARQILQGVETAKKEARLAAGARIGTLRVGWTTSGDFISFMPQALGAYRNSHPGVKVTLFEMITHRQIEAVAAGDLDVGVMRSPERTLDPGLSVSTVWTDQLVVAVRSDDPLAGRESVAIAELRDQAFVSSGSDHGMGPNYMLRKLCLDNGFEARIVQQCSSITIILGLVSAGVGIALVPTLRDTVQMRDLRFIPLSDPDAVCPLCTVHRTAAGDPLLQDFIDTIAACARTADAV